MFRRLPTILAAQFLCAVALAAPVRTPHVEAELIAERTAFEPGRTATVALRLKIADHWHTYWKNPGDSGLPTRIKWTLPESVGAGEIQWPHPGKLPLGPLMNYGYSGEVLHLVEIATPATLRPGDKVPLKARAEWLVCKDVCIPESAELELVLTAGADNGQPDPRWAGAFRQAREALPAPLGNWSADAGLNGRDLTIRIQPPAGTKAHASSLTFFPERENLVEAAAPQLLTRDGEGYRLAVKLMEPVPQDIGAIAGVLVADRDWPGLAARKAVQVSAKVGGALPPAKANADAELGGSLLLALVFALVGGAILNLMPCVFPVLGIKVMGFIEHAHGERRLRRMQGLLFAAGVLVSFWVLAGVMLALRAGGAQLGWGFQLQSPAFVACLAALFFVLALNLLGVFEMGLRVQSLAGNVSVRNMRFDAFSSGVLACLVATPCTAPFMGAAVGFTLAQPAWASVLVFTALAIGMALPVVLLSYFPQALALLPKPGKWMETFKQAMAFPLLATVIWLAWVLGAQAGNDAVLALFAGLLLIGIAAWIYGRWAHSGTPSGARPRPPCSRWPGSRSRGQRTSRRPARSPRPGPANCRGSRGRAREVAELRAKGAPVFVDFTAAWCITCQVNKRLALNDAAVVKRFAELGVTPLKADWTNMDPKITEALAEFGRNAVPVYVLYSADKNAAPKLLPEVLTSSIVLDELNRLPKASVAVANPVTR